MEERHPTDRLTEREKECLRLWLQHKTAKEIALELGISHFAVEKRLKMARTKLDVTSSLEAARLLADQEGCQQAVAQPADLPIPNDAPDRWFTRPLALGVVIMSILAAGLLALALQTSPLAKPGYETEKHADSIEYDSVRDEVTAHNAEVTMRRVSENFDVPEIMMVMGTPEQVEDHIASQFAEFDSNGSGYIEEMEGPRSIERNCCSYPKLEPLTGPAAWQFFVEQNEDDGDNRISYSEFRNVRFDRMLENGFAVKRGDVSVIGERQSPYSANPSDSERPRFLPTDFETAPATEERARAYVRSLFNSWDKDGSGFIELSEAPDTFGTPKATLRADGTLFYDRNDPVNELTGDTARAQYVQNVDQDGDERISFEEYSAPIIPHYVENGIPLIPADWTGPGAPG